MRAWTQHPQRTPHLLISWTPPVAEHGEPLLLGLDSQRLLHPGQRVWLASFCGFVFCEASRIIPLSQSLLDLQGRKQRNRLLCTWGLCCGGTTSFTAWLIYCAAKASAVQATEIWKEAFYPSPEPEFTSIFTQLALSSGNSRSHFQIARDVLVFSPQSSHLRNKWPRLWVCRMGLEHLPIVFDRHTPFHVGLFWSRTRLCPDSWEYISFTILFYFKSIKTLINQYALYDNS